MENGSIGVAIKRGSPGYQYALTENSDPATTVSGGTFYVDNLYMEGLKAGNYTLTLQEMGGANLTSGTSSTGVSLTSSSFPASTSNFTFTAADDSFYDIGYTSANSNASAASILFGARVESYKLYPIINGKPLTSPVAELKDYDVVEIDRTSQSLTCKVNGEQVYTTSYAANNAAIYLGVNQYGEGKILNIIINKTLGNMTWRALGTGVTSQNSNGSTITMDVTLNLNCSSAPPIVPPQPVSSNLTTYYKQSSSMREESVKVSLDESSAASLAVFNMNGILVYKDEHKDARTDHVFDIKGLPSGTYIFKILTRSKEYTGRLLIQ